MKLGDQPPFESDATHSPRPCRGHLAWLRHSVVLFSTALLLRLVTLLALDNAHPYFSHPYGTVDTRFPVSDPHRYIEIAMNLNEGRGFPVIYSTEPHAFDFRRGPLYMLFLAGVFHLFGFSFLAVATVQCILSALTVVLVKKLGTSYYDERTGNVAAWVWCLFPIAVVWPGTIFRETLTTFILMLTLVLFALYKRAEDRRWIMLVGAVMGLGVLQDPLLQMVMVVVAIALVWNELKVGTSWPATNNLSKGRRIWLNVGRVFSVHAVRGSLTVLLIYLFSYGLVVAPWLLYTHAKLGRPVIGTASEYGFWDNHFNYYWFKTARKQQAQPSWDDYHKAATEHRYRVARAYLQSDPPDEYTLISKKGTVDSLMKISRFASHLDMANFSHVLSTIWDDPSLYLGSPLGKTVLIKLSENWVNFMITNIHAPYPFNSNLCAFLNSETAVLRSLSAFAIVTSFVLFAIFIRYASTGRLLTVVWLAYWAFFFILWFRTESRYMLPVTPLALIVVSYGIMDLLTLSGKKPVRNPVTHGALHASARSRRDHVYNNETA